jgi:putative glutathione S-transferase
MGMLVEGRWTEEDRKPAAKSGEFLRADAGFRSWITVDGSGSPSGEPEYAAEAGRYHLYISHACPWANRTAIFHKLKGLEDIIGISVVDHFIDQEGWTFNESGGDETRDNLFNCSRLHQIYAKAKDDYTGRVTVPVLWDKHSGTIVSNESSEIIRMFNSAFNAITGDEQDFYPPALRDTIDGINERVYGTVNNGVYRCGFARSQQAYEDAYRQLFESLDWLEGVLDRQAFLAGDVITEADWRLFVTLARFDPGYFGHFKCNRNQIADFPNLSNYTRQLYQWPGVAQTINLQHIKAHYYASHESINPTRIVPLGPLVDYSAPHNRGENDC